MGNKKNRTLRRKKRVFNKRKTDKTASIENRADISNNITTSIPAIPAQPTVVDKVSILCPISDVQYELNYTSLHPITPSYLTEDVQDPLFVVKSEINSSSTSSKHSNEFIANNNVGSTRTLLLEIEPNLNENVIKDGQASIPFENHKCRLCLTKEGNNWIDIFSSEPYPYSNVDEITPSNIVESIEQFTTVKISKEDRLPDKLCLNCFQSLRFVYKFREKSLRSQNVLISEVNVALRKSSNEENQLVLAYGIQWTSTEKVAWPVPIPTKRLSFEEAYNIDKDEENFDDVQCEICGEIFEKYKSFQYHLNRHHDVRPFACTEPDCDKCFYSPQNRNAHILNIHSIDRKFKCDLCEKTYTKMEKLTYHRTTHFPPTIPCTVCGKLLRSQQSVRKHRASHAERLYKCDDCGKSFQNSYTLRVHQRIHTNEKPFICCKCGEAFAHKCSLKTHDEKKHPES